MYPLTHGEGDKPRIAVLPSRTLMLPVYTSKSTQGEKGNLVVHNSRNPSAAAGRGSSPDPAAELTALPSPLAGEERLTAAPPPNPLPLISIPMQTVCNT